MPRILAYIIWTVEQELLLRNEYLAAENRIIKAQLKTPWLLTDPQRITLAEIGYRPGRKALEDVAVPSAEKPEKGTDLFCIFETMNSPRLQNKSVPFNPLPTRFPISSISPGVKRKVFRFARLR